MGAPKIARAEAIKRIALVFRKYGYDGTTLSLISKTTGLGRASLYHHFPGGKEEIAREVFRVTGQQVYELVIAPLKREGTPKERLGEWVKGVDHFYAKGRNNCLLGTMVLSGGLNRFPDIIEEAFQAWIEALTHTLVDAGLDEAEACERARSAVARIQGALIVSRGLGNEDHFQKTLKILPDQLLEGFK
ncbi:MAG: TetR family transcriptional regulator [Elusimicrobia bacterium]|nr:MAG: TetR family transcriptional regulator [Elusimicrobiota bacterium]